MLGAIIRQAAKSAAKSKARNAASKAVSRARKAGDETYNARRRFTRSAERNLAKARQSSGATAARYKELARIDFENALSTYDPGTTQKFSRSVSNLANELGYNLEQERALFNDSTTTKRRELIGKSKNVLESMQSDEQQRREREATAIFNSRIGSRILGGLVDVWRDSAAAYDASGLSKIDKSKIYSILFDYFGVDNLADILAKIEEKIGNILYSSDDSETIYQIVKLKLQCMVIDNSLVA